MVSMSYRNVVLMLGVQFCYCLQIQKNTHNIFVITVLSLIVECLPPLGCDPPAWGERSMNVFLHCQEGKKKQQLLSPVQLCDPVDCNPSGSSIRGILPARRLESVAMRFSRGLPNPGIEPRFVCCSVTFLPSESPGGALPGRQGMIIACTEMVLYSFQSSFQFIFTQSLERSFEMERLLLKVLLTDNSKVTKVMRPEPRPESPRSSFLTVKKLHLMNPKRIESNTFNFLLIKLKF